MADYLLICSAESERQVGAIADHIEEGLRKEGIRPYGTEGANEGRWALIDYSDVIAHIFIEPVRVFYDLEGLWAEAPMQEVLEKRVAGGKRGGGEKGTSASRKKKGE